jgi:hypothetical protein
VALWTKWVSYWVRTVLLYVAYSSTEACAVELKSSAGDKFTNNQGLFTPRGDTWMVNTMMCLQNSLVPLATHQVSNVTCTFVKDTAFATHAPCYLKEGLCSVSVNASSTFRVFAHFSCTALSGGLVCHSRYRPDQDSILILGRVQSNCRSYGWMR